MHSLHARLRPLPWLALACTALVAGCSSGAGGTGGTGGNGLSISLNVPVTAVVGDHVDLQVVTQGCPQVKQLNLLNAGKPIKAVTPGPSPIPVTLHLSDIPWGQGIAASLTLTGAITCSDGRTATSSAVAVEFFPAAQVYANADGSPFVPDSFYAEGSGSSVTFVGCALVNGTQQLVRVNLAGQVTESSQGLPIPCDDTSTFTATGPQGYRWLMTPGKGAVAYSPTLNWSPEAEYRPDGGSAVVKPILPSFITTSPSTGDAFLVTSDASGTGWVFRSPRSGSTTSTSCPPNNVWCASMGLPQGPPVYDAATDTLTLVFTTPDPSNTNNLAFAAVTFQGSTGSSAGPVELYSVPFAQVGTAMAGLSADGKVAYVPIDSATASGSYTVNAASTSASAAPLWTSATLTGNAEAVVPSGDGTYVAAVGGYATWFLSADAGVPISKGQAPFAPSQGLVTTQLQAGLGRDFYLFNGTVGALPSEVVATDDPSRGELFRFSMPSGGVSMATDDSGQVWLRFGPYLVQALPLSTYRQLRGG